MPTNDLKPLPWILLLCAAALGLRSWGLDWLLPQRGEPDSQIVVQTRLLHDPEREKEEWFGTYGLLTAYAASLLPGPRQQPPDAGLSLAEQRANASAEVLRVRIAVVLLSLLLVPGTWWLARRALSPPAALFATALVAFSLLHLSMSQQARPHGSACALFLLAVLAAVRLRSRPTWSAYVIAGLAAGIAAGALQSGLSVLLPLVTAHVLRERTPLGTSFWRLTTSLVIAGAIIAACYPLLVSQAASLLWVDEGRIALGAHRIRPELFNGKGFGHLLWSLWSYEPLTLVLATLGLPLALARRPRERAARRELWVVLAFALPYAAAFGSFEGFQERMLLPLVPYLAVLAAFPLDCAWRRWGSTAPRLVAAAALVLLAFPAAMAARLSFVRASDDTLEQAASWLAVHMQPEKDVALVSFPLDLPLFHDDAALAVNCESIPDDPAIYPRLTRWFKYQAYDVQAALAPERVHLDRFGLVFARPAEFLGKSERVDLAFERIAPRYVVVELFPPEREGPGGTRIAEALRSRGRRVARFAPWRDVESSDLPYEHEALPSHPQADVVRFLLAADRTGPVIEIYALD